MTPLLATLALLGVSATEPGLKIKDTKVGTGREVVAGDLVTVLYRGTLMNGKEFDSSKNRPPFVFKVGAGEVIQGWDKGLLGMKTDGKRTLTVPPKLAYGDKGAGGDIPPKATLKFEIELLRIDRDSDEAKIEVKVLKEGEGEPAKDGDTIAVHYTGTFLNGFKFDSSYDRNEPFAVVLGQARVIQGFSQGLVGMKLKEKRRVVIPAKLGYKDVQRGPIPPNSTLVFELEAVRLTPKDIR